MRIKEDKRADEIVLPSTLKLIIAVLCIIALVYLAVSLYSLFIVKSKNTQARETLANLISVMGGLGEGAEEDHLINSPKDWFLIESEGQLCICDREYLSESEKECCKRGITEFVENVKIEGQCLIKTGFLRLNTEIRSGCISLQEIPVTVYLSKDGEIITIDSTKPEGILKEFLASDLEGQTVMEFIRSNVRPNGMDNEDKLENVLDGFFKENYWFQLKIRLKSSSDSFLGQQVFGYPIAYVNELSRDAEVLTYEFLAGEGYSERMYVIELRYKKK